MWVGSFSLFNVWFIIEEGMLSQRLISMPEAIGWIAPRLFRNTRSVLRFLAPWLLTTPRLQQQVYYVRVIYSGPCIPWVIHYLYHVSVEGWYEHSFKCIATALIIQFLLRSANLKFEITSVNIWWRTGSWRQESKNRQLFIGPVSGNGSRLLLAFATYQLLLWFSGK